MTIFGEMLTLPPDAPKKKTVRTVDMAAARDGSIEALWALKMDTYEISRKLHIPESVVANRLAALRDGRAT